MQFDKSYRQIGDCSKPYPEYVFKPDPTDKKHYLGGGAFGQVFKGFALERNYQPVAVKRITLKTLKKGANEQIQHSVDKEIEAFKKLKGHINHRNILQIYDVLRSTNNLYIVMEYCRHGDLEGFIKKKKRLTEQEAIELLTQTMAGLGVMHKMNMFHRDIKPANILLDNGVYKVCDYGLSTVAIANPFSMAALSSVGSPLYAAPEILKGKQYNSSIDVFSTGVMVYECLFGFTPWPARSLPELIKKQKMQKTIKFPRHPQISEDLKQVLFLMCMVDEYKRPTYDKLFQHKSWKKITQKDEEFTIKLKQQKDPAMRSIMMFNHQQRRNGQGGKVNQEAKKNMHKLMQQDNMQESNNDDIQAPQQKERKKSTTINRFDKQTITNARQKPNEDTIKKFEMQASQIQNEIHNKDLHQKEFDIINQRIQYDILKVQLANQSLESFKQSQFLFKSVPNHYKSTLVFALAKFQSIKIINLKRDLFNQKNIYNVKQSLWSGYLQSKQYSQMVEDIKYNSKMSYYILNRIYSVHASNFNHYYNTQDKNWIQKVQKIFNKNVGNMQDYQQVYSLIKGIIGFILQEIQMDMIQKTAHKNVLIASTYLLYVIMYEEKYKFNINNQVSFGAITELVEKYGEEALIKNLQQAIMSFNKK